MRILNVNTFLDSVTGGGGVERTYQMSRYLTKSGHECTILATDYLITDERIKEFNGIELVLMPTLAGRFFLPRASLKRIKEVVAKADIIHLMGHWSILNAIVYYFARREKVPFVVCPVGSLPVYGRSKILKSLYNIIIGKRIIRNANAHIAVTKDERLNFCDYNVDPENVYIIPNGITVNEFDGFDHIQLREKYGLSESPIILFLGRLDYIKGPDLLLRAFCEELDRFKRYQLVFAGPDSGMLAKLERIVQQYRAGGHVHFIGYIGGKDKYQALYASELVVIPSRQEAMSIVVLEAGITKTPVLVTDQCGISEISMIEGGMVVPASIQGLKEGLLQLTTDPQRLKIKGRNLYNYVCTHFIWEAIIKRYLSLYSRILEKENKKPLSIV